MQPGLLGIANQIQIGGEALRRGCDQRRGQSAQRSGRKHQARKSSDDRTSWAHKVAKQNREAAKNRCPCDCVGGSWFGVSANLAQLTGFNPSLAGRVEERIDLIG